MFLIAFCVCRIAAHLNQPIYFSILVSLCQRRAGIMAIIGVIAKNRGGIYALLCVRFL